MKIITIIAKCFVFVQPICDASHMGKSTNIYVDGAQLSDMSVCDEIIDKTATERAQEGSTFVDNIAINIPII